MIAVDVMGGDYAPHEIVQGALKAAAAGIPVMLFGDTLKIGIALNMSDRYWHRLPITIKHCSQVVEMDEEPVKAINLKQESSLVQAAKAVSSSQAHAVVSAGNSGAAMVAAMVHIGKLPGVSRPAIGGFLPTYTDAVFCLDLGANIECKAEHMVQFALMGDAYVRAVKARESVRVGLLANGTEVGKGTKVIQQVHETLQHVPGMQFVGNCEPFDILEGRADLVVSDGFSGNIMLKSMEATLFMLHKLFRQEGHKTLFSRLVALMGSPLLQRLKGHMKRGQRGGALLLGVNKPFIIAHGSSQAEAIYDAICFADEVSKGSIYTTFASNLADNIKRFSSTDHGSKKREDIQVTR